MKRLMILDGSSLLFRAFFALPPMNAATGEPTNAIFGFSNMLLRMLREYRPDGVVVAFDKSRHTFRTELYADYKGTRGATPDEFKAQVPLLQELLAAWGIPFLELDDFEADDIIGTLAARAKSVGEYEIFIVTGDRDELQLIAAGITVLYTKKGISEVIAYDEAKFRAEYGELAPVKLIDLKGLMGDSSDNIPGVPGVGPKTALKLLTEYGSLENLLAHVEEVSGKKLQERLRENAELARLSKTLAAIRLDAPVELDLERLAVAPDKERLVAFCQRYGLKVIQKNIEKYLSGDFTAVTAADTGVVPGFYPADEPAVAAVPWPELLDEAGKKYLAVPDDCRLPVEGPGGRILAAENVKALYRRIAPFDEPGEGDIFAEPQETAALPRPKLPDAFDIRLAAYLLDPTLGQAPLADIVRRYLPTAPVAPDGKSPEYAAWRREILAPLALNLHNELERQGFTELYRDIERPLVEVLDEMEAAGIGIDRAALAKARTDAAKRIDAISREIYELAGEEFTIGSTKQLSVVLFEKLGLTPTKKTKTGYSTNAEVLEELRGQHLIIEAIINYRRWTKLKSTYMDGLEPLIGRDDRIHTTFNQTVTATGRLSSSDPNLQNIPVRTEEGRAIRRLFRPGNGYDALLSADYSQIELRVLAHLSGDENFLRAFTVGEDIHARTAAEVFGVPLGEVTADMRRRAKAVNFGIVYGISDYGLARDLGISRAEAGEYIKKYFATCPGVKSFIDKTVAEAHKNGYVTTMFGRRRELPEIHDRNFNRRSLAERMAMNTPIQGAAADIIKLAMIEADKKLRQARLKSRILLQVHDELVLEVPAGEIETVAALLKDTMENIVKLAVPLVVDVHTGTDWAQTK